MKILRFIGFITLGLLASCSSSDDVNKGEDSATDIVFTAYSNVTASRAHSTTAMTSPYKVRITNKGYTATNNLTKERDVSSNGTYSTLYWDDISSKDVDVRTNGATVMALSDPRSSNAIASIPVNGQLTWSTPSDQTAGDKDYDLLVADYIGDQAKTSSPIQLCFHHAMTKITVNLIMGEDFDATALAGATVVLPAENTMAAVDLTKATGLATSKLATGTTPADIKMGKLTTPNTYTEGSQTVSYAASYEAIVSPGKQITNSTTNILAQIIIAGNTYNLTESQVEATWGDTLKTGNHYVIAARVSRSHITINAVVADWNNGGSVTVNDPGISFSNDVTGVESFDKALQADGFSIFRKESAASDYTNTPSLSFTYDKNTAIWTASDKIYWKDGLTRYNFRALSPSTLTLSDNKLSVATGTTDYLYGTTPAFTWGTESIAEGSAVPPRTGAVNLTFRHAMAKVTINFTQVSGDNGVNISDAKVILHNAKTKASLVMADGSFADYQTDAYTSVSNSSHTCIFYTLPQNLGGNTTSTSDDLYFEIIASGNNYIVTLKDILNIATGSQQTTIQDWEAGKHYVYTFSLYKKGVGFSASVLDWEDGGTTNGNISL
jgi:hypothetical protein